jgi:hypothetical protein
MDPNEYVVERVSESVIPDEQNEDASAGEKIHVPTVPATVVRTTFYIPTKNEKHTTYKRK